MSFQDSGSMYKICLIDMSLSPVAYIKVQQLTVLSFWSICWDQWPRRIPTKAPANFNLSRGPVSEVNCEHLCGCAGPLKWRLLLNGWTHYYHIILLCKTYLYLVYYTHCYTLTGELTHAWQSLSKNLTINVLFLSLCIVLHYTIKKILLICPPTVFSHS